MKKNFIYALLGAIALTGSVGFTSCTDKEVDVNPNYNPETGEVNVDLALSIGQGQHGTTRQSAANTQADMSLEGVNFRGIDNALVASNILESDGKHVVSPVTLGKVYNMGNLLGNGSLNPSLTAATTTQSKSRRVIELALPTGTNNIMFWGKAIKQGSSDNQLGAVEWNPNKDLSETKFTLKRRVPQDPSSGDPLTHGVKAFKQYEDFIASILNKLVNHKYTYSSIIYGGATYSGTIYWSDYVIYTQDLPTSNWSLKPNPHSPVIETSDLCPLGEILATAFVDLNTIYPNEVRAGSGPTIAKLLLDLEQVVGSVKDASPTSASETITRAFALSLWTEINKAITATTGKWVSPTTTVGSNFGLTDTSKYGLVTEDLDEFPTNFDMPYGAATLKNTITAANPSAEEEDDKHIKVLYEYNQTIPTYAMDGTAGGSFDVLNYRYPAELCYFGNSSVWVTDKTKAVSDYPDGASDWLTDTWTDWSNTHVLSSSRAVAMKENINYGSSLLKLTVKYKPNSEGNLRDNNKAIQLAHKNATESDKTISVINKTPFTLTGVLIGGVEETVGWNYLPIEPSSTEGPWPGFNSFIYDKDINGGNGYAIPAVQTGETEGAATAANYTLVWDNWNPKAKDQDQNVVYIALEFENKSGEDFWGMNNLIHKDSKFYITGKLDPNTNSSDRAAGIVWPGSGTGTTAVNSYALPPYAADGTTIKQRRVFIQDYVTEANFVFGEESLHSALVAVPDLRSSQISLGLSVDLKWNQGLKFENVILGGTSSSGD